MRLELARLQEDWRQRIFGTVGIRVELASSEGPCRQCGGPTEVQKSIEHRVVTLEYGDFIAHETVYVCKARCRQTSGELVTRRSEALVLKVFPGKVYGYDVEVFVGIERFLHNRQREEIRTELAQRCGISISSGHVSDLAMHFLKHIEELHTRRAPELRAAMDRDGGYPLHIDSTGEDGRGTMLVALSGWLSVDKTKSELHSSPTPGKAVLFRRVDCSSAAARKEIKLGFKPTVQTPISSRGTMSSYN